MTPRSWIDDEPRFIEAVRQTHRLFLDGLGRPIRVALWGILLAAALAGAVFLRKHTYSPHYVLRVVETDRDPVNQPRPTRDLADYVRQGVFTSEPLLALIRRYGLYPSLLRKSPRAALDSFREDTEVEVYRNYFVEERAANTSPRSARLSISYKNANRDVAVAVTRELGSLVADHVASLRGDQASRAADAARREVEDGQRVLESRRLEIESKREEVARTRGREARPFVELQNLVGSFDTLALRQEGSVAREAGLSMGASLERRGLGMSFETVDDGSLPTRSEEFDTELILAGATYIFGLPLVVVAIGAFAPKRGLA